MIGWIERHACLLRVGKAAIGRAATCTFGISMGFAPSLVERPARRCGCQMTHNSDLRLIDTAAAGETLKRGFGRPQECPATAMFAGDQLDSRLGVPALPRSPCSLLAPCWLRRASS